MYDLAIIGGGPAGVSAGIYAARKKLKTAFIAEHVGGQSTESADIQNWVGTPHIPGPQLAKALENHLKEYADGTVDLRLGERAEKVEKSAGGFSITTNRDAYEAAAVLVATGGARRKLAIPGADQYENKGITYCASCDGPMFSGQDVVVVGGGNAGFETAAQLLAYCKSVTMVHRRPHFLKADETTVHAVLSNAHMHVVNDSEPVEVKGDKFVTGLVVKNNATGETSEIPAAGIFVEIGMVPATQFVKGLVDFDEWSHVKVDARNQRSSLLGVWAAGDCSDGMYHQNNIAAGDAVKALEDIYVYLKTRAGQTATQSAPTDKAEIPAESL